jgi:hypothetical protein
MLLVALKQCCLMKKPDFWFIVVVLLIFLALLLVVLNIHGLFPTPSGNELAKSVILTPT